ncbi:VPA1262 family protein [Flavonifractor plautii]|uniref:Uncharacterized protein n=1 Tax=Flavonifractor plautii TaxID=292800 RepID=A0AAX1KI64_FLAPL|nr:VPA1262 family protein [Flavonifractor plautii]QQR05576.1 hypothetical protein I5Q84_16810 [Flavonifractor plautii]UQA26396.1 VPA1262 family protein [Flavonifractor plautii]
MQGENRFIKLLLFSTTEGEVLLYGFSSPTNQPFLPWKQRKISKKRQSVFTAILPFHEAEIFEKRLTQESTLSMAKITLKSPQLVIRPIVLVNDTHSRQHGPVVEYAYLKELWNVQKEALFQEILHAFGTDGKELYRDVQDLLQWCREECGIDFSSQGPRFGNFEHYQSPPLGTGFQILTHKELELKKVTIQKTEVLSRDLVVNCAAEHRGRWLINQTKLLAAEESYIEFTAEEPMSWVVVQIWDQETGDLLFARDLSMILGVNLEMNFSSSAYHIRDSWTKKLLQSASNRKRDIEEGIEKVQRVTTDRTVSVKSSFHTEIDTALETGDSLLTGYRKTHCLGSFIPNTGKDGEIDSFLKIREYLEESTVDRVILADPYFSVQAAEKLLTRIPRTNLQLDIVTCLGMTDPDTGEASDICKVYEKFLLSNAKLLHGRLSVRNLRRGNKPVFHDRYLLRFHNDQHIDGFLLSNSLNKMGQNYPFVIAPLERKVTLEVCEYLTQMCDPKTQEKRPPKDRIICDILYDSAVKPIAQYKRKLSPSPLKEWLGPEYCENSRNAVPKENLPVAVTEVWSHWGQDKEGVCRVLGELCSNVFQWSIEDVAETLKNMDGAAEEFLMWFSACAEEKERNMKHDQNGINAPEYKLWALLHDRATASRAGLHFLFDQAGHIWYQEDWWLHGSYRLMLGLSPESFLLLMDASRSPLMFDVLATRMLFYSWSESLLLSASKAKLLHVQLLCARWMFSLFRDGKLSDKQVLDTLAQLTPQKRSLQTAYFLSQITFFVRTKHTLESNEIEKWEPLYRQLLSHLAADLPCCSEQERNTALFWLYDSEQCSQCSLQLDLSRYIEDPTIREAVLQQAVVGIQKYLIDSNYERNLETAVDLYLTSAEQLYGDEAEKQILGKLVDWRTFERAAEPELKNYAYDKWHYAYIRAKWQLLLLAKYAQRHPEAEKTLKWLKEWRMRFPDITNEKSGLN